MGVDRNNLLEASFTEDRKFTLFNASVTVPDQLEIQAAPESVWDIAVHVIMSFQTYLETEARANFFLAWVPFYAGLAYTELSSLVQQGLSVQGSATIYARSTLTLAKMTMRAFDGETRSAFHDAVDQLPGDCEGGNRAACDDLFNRFGTHYNQMARVGVQVTYVASISAQAVAQHSVEWCRSNFMLWVNYINFMLGIDMGYDGESDWSKVDVEFKNAASLNLLWNGQLFDPAGKGRDWVWEQAMQQPVVALSNRAPITDMLLDSQLGRKLVLQTALQRYMESPTLVLPPKETVVPKETPQSLATAAGLPNGASKSAFPVQSREPHRPSSHPTGRDKCTLPEVLYLPIPGDAFINRGFLRSSGESTLQRIYLHTYDKGGPAMCFTHPEAAELTWKIPEQVYLSNNPGRCSSAGVHVSQNAKAFTESTWEVSKESSWFGLASTTRMRYHFVSQNQQNNKLLITNETCITTYSLASTAQLRDLNPQFKAAVNKLPLEWRSDPNCAEFQAYDLFLRTWGTDYVTDVTMGARTTMYVYFHECFMAKLTIDVCLKMSGWSILGLINHMSGSAGTKTGLEVYWDTYTEIQAANYGGHPLYLPFHQAEHWRKTVPANMAPVRLDFTMISDIVRYWDEDRGRLLEAATRDFLARENIRSDQWAAQQEAQRSKDKPDWCR